MEPRTADREVHVTEEMGEIEIRPFVLDPLMLISLWQEWTGECESFPDGAVRHVIDFGSLPDAA